MTDTTITFNVDLTNQADTHILDDGVMDATELSGLTGTWDIDGQSYSGNYSNFMATSGPHSVVVDVTQETANLTSTAVNTLVNSITGLSTADCDVSETGAKQTTVTIDTSRLTVTPHDPAGLQASWTTYDIYNTVLSRLSAFYSVTKDISSYNINGSSAGTAAIANYCSNDLGTDYRAAQDAAANALTQAVRRNGCRFRSPADRSAECGCSCL